MSFHKLRHGVQVDTGADRYLQTSQRPEAVLAADCSPWWCIMEFSHAETIALLEGSRMPLSQYLGGT